ncbi:MAG: phage Gp37/Gp68 family protein [Deltaproteobacteria bacterium]|jgi:protein gp37|nr:phage Gp37/Gp68 family protein [Deltaproteobacteria bacterium]
MTATKIEWTDKTWNPVTGCSKLSPGCAHCYAETMAHRLKAMGAAKYANGFAPTLHYKALSEPENWRRPQTIFVCSMSDLFHQEVPFAFVDEVMDTIRRTPWHTYQILTKRAERMADYFQKSSVPNNVWLGVTIEAPALKPRLEYLRVLDPPIRFISCEPLVEDLGELDLSGIDWVIVGGESGAQGRPMKPSWVHSLLEQANRQGLAFFFKQWGAWGPDGIKRGKKSNGREIDGQIMQTMPPRN